ncbi:MAG: T9SS type A sorting domain-containing protein [Bacteroidetes bacterium]|nr:T9SS type A sorting domain-containing protein [Bacteroidota bacterium]
MTKHLLPVFCFLSLFSSAKAQIAPVQKYYTEGFLTIKSGPFTFDQPFLGGLNSPQFQNMDLNNDGTNDLLIFDKSDGRFLTFLRKNKNEHVYAPRYESTIPKCLFFCKTADLNADGKQDIFTLDETRNLFIYKNITASTDSFPKFQNLGAQQYRNQYDTSFWILFNAFTLASTDLPDISDVDGDGDLDIVAYDQFYNIYTMYKDVRVEKGWTADTFEFQKWDVCFGYFNDFNNSINLGQCPYKQKLKLRHSGGSACLLFDADEDGDKEMVLSNIGQKSMFIVYNGKSDVTHEYDTMTHWDSIFPANTTRATDYEFPAGFLFDVDGDGIMDLVTAPNGVSDVKETYQTWYYRNFGKNNKPDFKFIKNNFISDKTLDLGAASSPAFCDADGDGDQDLFVASNGDFVNTLGVKDRIAYFKNTGTSKVPIFELMESDYYDISNLGLSDIVIRFGDVDGDGDQDLVIGDRMGYVRWFKNSAGAGQSLNLTLASTDLVGGNFTTGETNAAPLVFDYNHDSLPDMLVGYYHGAVILYQNTGSVAAPAYTRISGNAWGMHANEWLSNISNPGFSSYGYAVPELLDINRDGIQELLVGCASGIVRLYHYAGHSVTDSLIADTSWLWKKSFADSIVPDFGYRITLSGADITGDSIPEILIGCSRGGLHMASSLGTVLGVKHFQKIAKLGDYDLFPNPANNYFEITRDNSLENWNIIIRDISGKVVLESEINRNENHKRISVSRIPVGVYVVELHGKNAVSTEKLVIQNDGTIR